jgi:hypothetical protein
VTGPTGPKGDQGDKGETGVTGLQGDKGDTGDNGLSVYESWLSLGNAGTEQEFLDSLKGATGATGLDGNKIYPIYNSGDYNNFYRNSKVGDFAIWYATVAPGGKGDVYYRDTDGNVYKGFSMVGYQGNTGATGAMGATGATGLDGKDGTDGKDGVTGATGATGLDGKDGITGPTGVQGNKGDTGATGISGATGAKGDKGDTGATGVTGPQGDKGDQGDTGLSAYEVWLNEGNTGTEQDFLDSLGGGGGSGTGASLYLHNIEVKETATTSYSGVLTLSLLMTRKTSFASLTSLVGELTTLNGGTTPDFITAAGIIHGPSNIPGIKIITGISVDDQGYIQAIYSDEADGSIGTLPIYTWKTTHYTPIKIN